MTGSRPASLGVVTGAMTLLLLAGCGGTRMQADTVSDATVSTATSVETDEPSLGLPDARLDSAAKQALGGVGIFETLFDPAFPMPSASMSRFDAVFLGEVIEFRPGPAYEVFPDDPDAEQRPILVVRPIAVLTGAVEVGEPTYVRFTISDVAGLNRVLPAGSIAMLAVNLVDEADDRYFDDPQAGVPAGAPRFDVGPTFAAFADGGAHTWYPMLRETHDQPLTALVPPSLRSLLPRSLR